MNNTHTPDSGSVIMRKFQWLWLRRANAKSFWFEINHQYIIHSSLKDLRRTTRHLCGSQEWPSEWLTRRRRIDHNDVSLSPMVNTWIHHNDDCVTFADGKQVLEGVSFVLRFLALHDYGPLKEPCRIYMRSLLSHTVHNYDLWPYLDAKSSGGRMS
jgi:hypothetical protein